MRAYLHRKYQFSSSHRLHSDDFDDARNREVYGKCNNPHGHGHNYVMEVTVAGEPDAITGMIVNLSELDRVVQKEIVARFDLANLNMDPEFLHTVPTTENLSIVGYEILRKKLAPGLLQQVKIEETSNNTFVYGGN